ncbi:MAG: S-adenosylmethionine:tRNA ribosyltransferase-isomerase, partial [Planctomycetota bacterium]
LPPYILRARGDRVVPDDRDRAWYRTLYADPARAGSVAAPTAGFHYTPELLARLDAAGCERHRVTLHVGAGTFRPVETPTLAEHEMHVERYEVPPDVLSLLARRPRPRVIAVGTTTCRALESLPEPPPSPAGGTVRGATRLLIAPPYAPRHVDGLLTNFHLPRSTLLALVAALLGLERLRAVYREAIAERYRFYSYGDTMLILP